MRNLKEILKKYRKELAIGPVFKLIEAIIEVLLPILVAKLIDNMFIYTANEKVRIGIFLFIIIIVGFICASISQYFAAKASQGFGTELRNKLFSHILNLSNTKIQKYGSSALVNRLTNNVINIETAVAMWIRLVIRVPFICIASIVMLFIINTKIAWQVIIATMLFSLIIFIIVKIAAPLHQRASQKLDKLLLVVKENLVNIKVVRSFVAESKETEKLEKINEENEKLLRRANTVSGLLSPCTTIVLNLALIFILQTGKLQINSGMLTQGELIACINYVSQMLLAVIVLSNLITIYTRAFASASRIGEVLKEPEEADGGSKEEMSDVDEAILMKDVSFKYTEERRSGIKGYKFTNK